MKKVIILLCVIAVLVPFLAMSASAADPIVIWKTDTSPKIDCILEDSYQLIADSLKNPSLFKIKKNQQNIKNHVEIYACWDKDSLYLYVKADCNDPHIAYQDDAAKHYIFNAHYMMAAICPDDSSQAKYKGTNDANGGWDWGTLYSKNFLYEWTTIFDSKAKKKARADHFGTLGQKTGYEYEAKSEKGFDIYEQKIPMKMLTTSVMPSGLKPAVGSVFGLGISVGFVDVGTDYKEDQQVNTDLSNYFTGKNLNGLTLIKLDSKLNEPSESEETSSAVSSIAASSAASGVSSAASAPTSKAESSKAASISSVPSADESGTDTESTFDYWWIIITGSAAIIVIVVVFLIIRKRNQ